LRASGDDDRGPFGEHPEDEPAPHRHTAEMPVIEPGDEDEQATAPEPQPQRVAKDDRPASLVIQTSFLGDMVLTTGLIAELARRGPVDVVATPASAPLLANNPDVRDVIRYDKRGDARGLGGLWRTAELLRRRANDEGPRKVGAAYLAQGSTRSAVLAVMAGIRERVGFDTSSGRALYTKHVTYRDDRHHAERLWRLAHPDVAVDPPRELVRPRLFPGLEEVSQVDGLLGTFPEDDERPLVGLAPGSIWATKRWPGYPELARLLAPHARLVTIGGVGDAPLAAEIVQAARASTGEARVLDAMGRLSLLASAELVARLRVLVTNDSAPQHLASAMDTPTVAIFGPTVPDFGFGPLASRQAIVGHAGLACRPCDRHGPDHCPLGHWKCMIDVPAAHVAAKVHELLA
jgi:heptosyltransferase II